MKWLNHSLLLAILKRHSDVSFRILKLGVNLLVFLFLILMYNSSDGKLFNRWDAYVISLKPFRALTLYSMVFPSLSK